jgi:predicted Zn-dependent protease
LKLARAFAALLASLALVCAWAPGAAAQGGLIRDSEIEALLRDLATPIWRAANLEPAKIDMYVVQDDTLNAFVAGGENIFVHTGLISAADTPNEIIGVLAHETGHITGGHLVRNREAMRRSMGPALISIGLGILALAAGAPDAGAALISGSQAFAYGNFVRHTQVQESAADQAALSYLEGSGQSPNGIIDFFNTEFRRYEFDMRRAPPYLLSHPFTSDRVQALRVRAEASPYRDVRDTPEMQHRLDMAKAKLFGYLMTEQQTLNRYPVRDQSMPARYARAFAYYRAVDVPRATTEITALIAAEPDNPFFHEISGQLMFENGRAAEAVPELRRAVALKQDDALLLVLLARALVATDTRAGPATTEAISLLARATQIEPDNAFAWRELAAAHDFRGEEGLARLASAEQSYVVGDFGRALNFAERAQRTLQQGEPSWQRANDIATFSRGEMADARERRS